MSNYWTSPDFLHDLIEQVPAGIFWKDKHSTFLGCNHFFAQLAALSDPTEIVGKTDYDLPWGQFQAIDYINDDNEVMASKKPKLGIEEKQTLADGREIFLLTNKIPLVSKSGEVLGILGVFHDISRRKQMEVSLEQETIKAQMANEAKSAFIANMSHDIRTPLTGVIGLSHFLHEQLECPDNRQLAQWIFESGQQLLSLLNNILDIVSLDTLHDQDVFNERFDLAELIFECMKLHRPASVCKGLDFQLCCDEQLPMTIISDRSKIYRILLNLLSNAIKFTSAGYVRLEVNLLEKQNEFAYLEFCVSDTGIGMPQDVQAKVFERFFRAHPSYKGAYKGHGLGLHIAKNYADLLGGEMEVSSTPGKGTRFSFKLKVGALASDMQMAGTLSSERLFDLDVEDEVNEMYIDQTSIKIMLVEDNHIAKKMLEIFCQKLDYQLDCFQTVDAAYEAFQNKQYDLIITDIGLPVLSGYDLAEMFRSYEKANNLTKVPILGLTAHAQYMVKNKGLNAGMQEVMNKPITLDLLKRVVNSYCSLDKAESIANQGMSAGAAKNLLSAHHYEKYDLFHQEKALSRIQSKSLLREMVLMFLEQDLMPAEQTAVCAFEQENYEMLCELVHKIRGGAVYCATDRLLKISSTLEDLLLSNKILQVKNLFFVWTYILHHTIAELRRWIAD